MQSGFSSGSVSSSGLKIKYFFGLTDYVKSKILPPKEKA